MRWFLYTHTSLEVSEPASWVCALILLWRSDTDCISFGLATFDPEEPWREVKMNTDDLLLDNLLDCTADGSILLDDLIQAPSWMSAKNLGNDAVEQALKENNIVSHLLFIVGKNSQNIFIYNNRWKILW
jgi:hypothetical protein